MVEVVVAVDGVASSPSPIDLVRRACRGRPGVHRRGPRCPRSLGGFSRCPRRPCSSTVAMGAALDHEAASPAGHPARRRGARRRGSSRSPCSGRGCRGSASRIRGRSGSAPARAGRAVVMIKPRPPQPALDGACVEAGRTAPGCSSPSLARRPSTVTTSRPSAKSEHEAARRARRRGRSSTIRTRPARTRSSSPAGPGRSRSTHTRLSPSQTPSTGARLAR